MNPQLVSPFNRLQKRKNDLLKQLEKVEEEVLHEMEAPGKWSVCQVLVHLMDTERSSLMYCHKKLLAGDNLPDRTFRSMIRMAGLRLFLRSGAKIKTSSAFQHPSNEPSLQEIIKKWNHLTAEERQFLDEFPDKYLHKAIFRHPLAGRIRVKDMVRFFEGHVAHHERQIKRILSGVLSDP